MILDGASGVREGDVIAGKYRVERVLGAGGMGVVLAAHHIQLEERVAIKLLLPHALTNPDIVARFTREARAAVKINNEHVARVIDVDVLPSGAPYIVMEYLEGLDLAAWIADRGPLAVETAVDFVVQACVAVADAHALGIVHRDLKPANLFCVKRSDGRYTIKVLDFGISKMTDAAMMTRTASLLGSPFYMSPEQMHSAKDVDSQSDIWALGVVLFELLAGRPPFWGESLPEVAIKITNEPPPSIHQLRPEVPVEVEAVISRCLEKDRSRRFRNVADFALRLAPFAPGAAPAIQRVSGILDGAGLATARASSLAGGSATASAGALPALGRTTTGTGGGRRWGVVGSIGMLVLGGIAMGLRFHATRSDPHARAAMRQPPLATTDVPGDAASAGVHEVATPPTTDLSVTEPVTPMPPAPAPSSSWPPKPPTRAPIRPISVSTVSAASPISSVRPPTSLPSNCDPPYYIDPRGNRMYKMECL